MSTVTGTRTARQMRSHAPSSSRRLTRSPSAYPSDHATPALVVPIAGEPASSNRRALTASHAFTSTNARSLS
jgi:hypothetical protein